MIVTLASTRNRTNPQEVQLRRSRAMRPGFNRDTTVYVHPASLARRRRQYRQLVERSREDVVTLVRPIRERNLIPGISCPDETSDWADIHAFRAKWGLPPVTQQ